MDRRDLFKLFAAGASVAPVVAGIPKIEAVAKLIELPKIEPVEIYEEMPPPQALIRSHQPAEMRVSFRSDGLVWHFEAVTYVQKSNHSFSAMQGSEWELRGRFISKDGSYC